MRASWLRRTSVLKDRAVVISFFLAALAFLTVLGLALAAEVGDDGFRNVALAIGAIAAFPVLVWRTTIGVQEANSADDRLRNERFQTAAQMLGNSVLAVRIGGVQALSELAGDAPGQYHVQIMRLLCAFVRTPPADEDIPAFRDDRSQRLRGDSQAAMQAIGARRECHEIEKHAPYEPNLIDADLRGSRLYRSDPSRLVGIRTDFTEAILADVNLDDAVLEGAKFVRTVLTGEGIDNPDAKGNASTLQNAVLAGADFSGADLTGVKISGADFARMRGPKDESSGNHTRGEPNPAIGLTQTQLETALADPTNPPLLDGVKDSITGEPLVWRGKSV